MTVRELKKIIGDRDPDGRIYVEVKLDEVEVGIIDDRGITYVLFTEPF